MINEPTVLAIWFTQDDFRDQFKGMLKSLKWLDGTSVWDSLLTAQLRSDDLDEWINAQFDRLCEMNPSRVGND